jgi:hypothetical protein
MWDTRLTVSHPLTITIEAGRTDFNGIVEAIQAAARQASGELLGRAMREVERWAVGQAPGRWENRGQQRRTLALPWGRTTLRRTRVRERQTGKTYNLADRLLGLPRSVRLGTEAVRTACELAICLSYRQAHFWWQRLTGLRCSLMHFWRLVQRGGRRLVQREDDEVGEVRAEDPAPRAVRRAYLEADGVWLRRQPTRRRDPEETSAQGTTEPERPDKLLLYVGASYSELKQTGRGRRNAVDKQVLAEPGPLASFARQWAWQVSRRFDLGRTPNQLFLSDGDDGLSRLPQAYFPQALIQLDRFHVHQQLGRAFGLKTPGYRTALTALCRGELPQVRSLLALRGTGERRAVCHEVRAYLDRHETTLYTHREWKRRTTVNKMGSGVIEKTIETQINRRMKKQGMSWSVAGARHLSKLRVLYSDAPRWEAFWSAPAR